MKKVKEDGSSTTEATPEETPAATPAASATPKSPSGSTRASARSGTSSSRRAKRVGSNVFSMFSQKQVAEFKEVSPPSLRHLTPTFVIAHRARAN